MAEACKLNGNFRVLRREEIQSVKEGCYTGAMRRENFVARGAISLYQSAKPSRRSTSARTTSQNPLTSAVRLWMCETLFWGIDSFFETLINIFWGGGGGGLAAAPFQINVLSGPTPQKRLGEALYGRKTGSQQHVEHHHQKPCSDVTSHSALKPKSLPLASK